MIVECVNVLSVLLSGRLLNFIIRTKHKNFFRTVNVDIFRV